MKAYERHVRLAQRKGRIPAVSVAVHRADRPLWSFQIGADADARFRIGSITKTFTAVLVLQCRDDGLLDLDDPLGRHLTVPAHGDVTVARLLSHTGGLQREPHGDMWDTMHAPGDAELLATLDRAERVLPAGRRTHYSNLAYGLLGRLVSALRGAPWAALLNDRVLSPLGLAATSVQPTSRAVPGYLVDAYSDHARREPVLDCGALAPAAQLWSTAADMAKWAGFLADPSTVDPAGAVLAASTVDEMRYPRAVADETRWHAAFGLGINVVPQSGKERVVHVGHGGAMPGFLASAYGRRGGDGVPPGLGVATLGSSGTGVEVLQLAHTLLGAVATEDPADIEPWRPGEAAPSDLRSVLGRWWGEGFEYVFFWRDGKLHAREHDEPPAVFVRVDGRPDVLRTESGREAGELLRLTRDPAGAVVRMHWATYRFTRGQESFDGTVASEPG